MKDLSDGVTDTIMKKKNTVVSEPPWDQHNSSALHTLTPGR